MDKIEKSSDLGIKQMGIQRGSCLSNNASNFYLDGV
jgi:hypothetical protein